jgi:hypothetical protein
MSEFSRALEQIAEIHQQLARSEVYRGWRSAPVACSGLVGLAAAGWQSTQRPIDPWSFAAFWIVVGVLAMVVGCSEIIWHYATRADDRDRCRSRRVIGQFLPALVAGALATGALIRLSPALVTLLPGLWALLFGVAVFASRPYTPRAAGFVGLYYWTTGLLLLWNAQGVDALSPWAVGGTFGVGQLLAAGVLYLSLERKDVI